MSPAGSIDTTTSRSWITLANLLKTCGAGPSTMPSIPMTSRTYRGVYKIDHDGSSTTLNIVAAVRWCLQMVQVRALPVRDTHDRITGWYVLLIDIHDRKRAEEALRQANITSTRSSTQFQRSPGRRFRCFAEFFNQRWLDFTGLSTDQAMVRDGQLQSIRTIKAAYLVCGSLCWLPMWWRM